jgi:hypothetical protein
MQMRLIEFYVKGDMQGEVTVGLGMWGIWGNLEKLAVSNMYIKCRLVCSLYFFSELSPLYPSCLFNSTVIMKHSPEICSSRGESRGLVAFLTVSLLLLSTTLAAKQGKPIILEKSGGFEIGGTVISNGTNPNQTLSCDHGYMECSIPWIPR